MVPSNVNPKWVFAIDVAMSQLSAMALVHNELVRLIATLTDTVAPNLSTVCTVAKCVKSGAAFLTAQPFLKPPCRLQHLVVNCPVCQMTWTQVGGCKLAPFIFVVIKILNHSAHCCIDIIPNMPLRKLRLHCINCSRSRLRLHILEFRVQDSSSQSKL